jgi:2',3'-cyclic-nucleotide 2'-phosphodiesterase/3'-nucleotidase
LGNTWISQPGRFGNVVTRFEVILSRRDGKWRVDDISGRNMPMKDVTPDPQVAAAAEPEHAAAMKVLAETVATLEAPVDASQAHVADTGLIDWLHAVQRREGRADLSFASLLPGSLSWGAGPLTVREVWSFYPYENALITVRATGRQVREALEDAARCVSGLSEGNGGAAWARNPAVWGYNCDSAEGIEYALDPTRPEGQRVLYIRRAGHPVGDGDVFTVAINSYRASGGGGYAVWRNCPRVAAAAKPLRDLLLDDARARKTLRLEPDFNWFLAPTLPEAKFTPN